MKVANKNMPETTLRTVISINPSSIAKDYSFKQIEYIDITSVGSGVLLGTTFYNISEAPSRAKRLILDGDTILSTVRPNRRSFLFVKNPPENLVVSTGFAVLRASEKIDPRFLYYTVTNQPFTDYLTVNAKGAAYPAVDTDTIARAKIHLPNISVQKKIASILSAYDDLIENNNRRIKILEEMAQAIYKEWFVNFRFPGHEKVKMIKSEIGKISTGWIVKRLGDCVKLSNGKSIKPDNIGQFPVYGSNGIIGTSNRHNFENGVIIGRVGAYCGSINRCRTNFWASDNTIVALPISHSFGMPFIYYLLQYMELNKYAGGSAQPLLTQATLNKLLVIAPPCDLFSQFDIVAGNILANIDIITKKTSNLRKTRDLLLPKLISGEIDVEKLDIKSINKVTV